MKTCLLVAFCLGLILAQDPPLPPEPGTSPPGTPQPPSPSKHPHKVGSVSCSPLLITRHLLMSCSHILLPSFIGAQLCSYKLKTVIFCKGQMGKANVQDLGRSNQKKPYSTKKKLLNKTWCTVVTILCNLSVFRKVIFNFILKETSKE